MRAAAIVFFAILAGAAVFAQNAPKADVLYVDASGEKRREVDVEVTLNTHESLVIRPKGKTPLTLTRDQVVALDYRDVPEAFARGRELLRDGQWAAAAKIFEAQMNDPALMKSAPWVAEESAYNAFLAATHRGDVEAQAAAGLRLGQVAQKSRHRVELVWIDALDGFAAGRGKSDALFTEIEESPIDGPYTRRDRRRAFVIHAMMLASKGAVADFDALAIRMKTAIEKDPAYVAYERLVAGYSALASKKFRDATAAFAAAATRAPDDAFALAHAWNGRARASFAEGRFSDVVLEASRTPALYLDDPMLLHETGDALWLWAEAHRKLAEAILDPKDPKAAELMRRFRDLRRRAADDFPTTQGGKLAKKDRGE